MSQTLAERLKRALDSHSLRQKDFAELSGLTPQVVSNLLMGRDPRLSTYEKVDRALRQLEADK